MQQARIYRAWLPSEIFWKYGTAVEREKTIANRLRRPRKRGKLSRAALVFDAVLNSRQYEIPAQNLSQIYDITSIFTQFCADVRQLKKFFSWFSMDTTFKDLIVHWSIAALKFFKENLSTNFGLIAVFVRVPLEITKRVQHCVRLIPCVFMVFRNRSSVFAFSLL